MGRWRPGDAMRFGQSLSVVFFLSAVPAMAADSRPADSAQACVDVQIGNDRSAYLNCLNDAMQRAVEHQRATPEIAAPIDTHSPSNRLGLSNEAAAREHMGNAFGVSAAPQRPASVFVNPIVPPTAR
jgi:hypothetical protein